MAYACLMYFMCFSFCPPHTSSTIYTSLYCVVVPQSISNHHRQWHSHVVLFLPRRLRYLERLAPVAFPNWIGPRSFFGTPDCQSSLTSGFDARNVDKRIRQSMVKIKINRHKKKPPKFNSSNLRVPKWRLQWWQPQWKCQQQCPSPLLLFSVWH